jgi:hypothetical protein
MLSSKWLIFRPPTDCQLHSHDYVVKMSETLARVAEQLGDGATVTSVAIAWALLKFPYVFPIST